MKIFYSPNYTIATHSFETTRKSRWVAESLAREPIAGIELVAPEPTSAAALSRVHDPEYVDAVRTGNPRELAESVPRRTGKRRADIARLTRCRQLPFPQPPQNHQAAVAAA